MTRSPSPRTVALRDQLLTALRDSDLPMTTTHIASLSGLPFWEVDWVGDCDLVHHNPMIKFGHVSHCDGTVHHRVAMAPDPGRVYQHLRKLEDAGIIRRLPPDPAERERFWTYCGDPTDTEFNAIIEAMERAS